jgi:protoporphyrinogen oxidase
MSAHDVLVIGGGISGASFAHACARAGLKVLVAEKTGSAGGCLNSARIEGGYWFEVGAHTCYNSYRSLLAALEEKGALDKLLPRVKVPFRLLSRGKIRSITSELNVLSLLAHAPRIVTASKTGRTVREYYGRLVGEGNYQRVFGPLFAAVPSQPADDFPAEMLFKKRERRADLPRSFTVAGGLQTIVDVLLESPKISSLLNAEVSGLSRDAQGFRVRFTDGSEQAARFVALAVPPPVGAALARERFPALSAALSRLAITPISSIGVVVRREATQLEPVAGIIPLDGRFYSAVSRDTVPDPTFRGFAFHFKPSVTLEAGLQQACEVLGVDRTKLQHVVQRQVTLPSPRLGHDAITLAIDEAVRGSPLFVTGNYFGGLAIEDCVLRSDTESSRLLSAAGAATS